MDMFADEEKQRISSGQPQYDTPPRTGAQTFGQDGKERDAQKGSGCETNQRTKRLVLEAQRSADRSTGKRENIRRDDLPECVGHSGPRERFVIFAAVLRLDGDVNQFVVPLEQRPIGIAALWLVRHHRDHCRKFSDADLPDV